MMSFLANPAFWTNPWTIAAIGGALAIKPLIGMFQKGGAINNLMASVLNVPETFFFNPGYTSLCRLQVMSSGRLVRTRTPKWVWVDLISEHP